MAYHASIQRVINAPIEKVWKISSEFTGIAKWCPQLFSSSDLVEGEANVPGCVRRIVAANGFAEEKLLVLDPENYLIKYSVQKNAFQLDGMVATFKLTPGDGNTTIVDWSYEIAASETKKEEEVSAFLLPLYDALVNGIIKFVE